MVAAHAFARFLQMDRAFLNSGFYTYNPLLVGLSIGYLFELTALSVFFVVVAGVSAFVLTHMLYSIFSYYLKLPILSLPFVLVSSTAYLAASTYTNLYVTGLYPHPLVTWEALVPAWIGGFFQSLGAIFFMPYVAAGVIFAAALFLASRIAFALAVAGYYTGTLTLAWMGGSYPQAFADFNAFNFILIAMALGGVFLIPSMKSYVMALLAVVASTMLVSSAEAFWALYSVPVFALPFNVVTLTFLYVLGLVEFPLVAKGPAGTPEQILDEYVANAQRYPGSLNTLALPFSGRWSVWQGFDGQWTHQGPWRYAYDFVITDDEGQTHEGEGTQLSDYYAFGKPVLSPVRGRVVRVVTDVPDNAIGSTNRERNWGNLVLIAEDRKFFVELSHFAEGSIVVKPGQWVERGTKLGLCGNSGYSPQPHLHVQVQPTDDIGGETVPFSFVSYRLGRDFHANDIPPEDRVVEPLFPDKGLQARMGFVLDETFTYDISRKGSIADRVTLTVRMASDGTFYLDSGKAQLYFGTFEDTFFFYRLKGTDPALEAMFLALPRMPLAYRRNLEWTDQVPMSLVTRGILQAGCHLLRSIHHSFGSVRVHLSFVDATTIEGSVSARLPGAERHTRVVLHPHRGFQSLQVGDVMLQLVSEE